MAANYTLGGDSSHYGGLARVPQTVAVAAITILLLLFPCYHHFRRWIAKSGLTRATDFPTSSVRHDPIPRAGPGSVPPGPIAICGIACRLPCGIRTPQQLWSFLLAGKDARGKVPESRYNADAFFDPSGKPGTTKTQHGYFLDEDIARLDTSLYSMSRSEVEKLDPQQRLMLEVARETFEDGGETGWRGKKIGCYIGSLGDDWLEMLTQDSQLSGPFRLTGYGDYCLSNRISFEMDLRGPSMTVRTACSSSLVALHEACAAINRGDCCSAIVGGTNLILRPNCTTAMSEQGVLSPDGSCKSFSAQANGYARGEAIVGVFLKPLDNAIRDGNSIRAVVRGTATNHDGRTAAFSVPSSESQETLIRHAYNVAGLEISDTGYVECHGTGTPVGDPIEATAVARVFDGAGVTIGSIKPHFGHTEGASGVLSVLKAVLMLQHKMIPPSIKSSPANPAIPWESGNLRLSQKPSAWPARRRERISVNSFGLGGSNAHAIIESAKGLTSSDPAKVDTGAARLLLYSAHSTKSLTMLMDNYKTWIREKAPNMEDVAYTLARAREHLPYRAFAIADSSSVRLASTIAKPSQQESKIAMVFTGQGAQWPRMGSMLLETNPVFRASIYRLDAHLKDSLEQAAPDWSIAEELLKSEGKSRVNLAEFSQPLCTAVQIALVDTLHSIGVNADAVVGHSSGEIAAAYAAGALTAREAVTVAFYRGIAVEKVKRPGAMAALAMGAAEARAYIGDTTIACYNSPRSVTISGDTSQIEEALKAVRAARPDILARKLHVDKAYHSHHMSEIGDAYTSSIERNVVGKRPDKLFFSSVETKLLDNDSVRLGPQYWQKNLESPVQFDGAVTSLLRHFSDSKIVLLEIGPHSALAGPLTQIVSEVSSNTNYVPTITRNQDSNEAFLSTVGKLFTLQVPLDVEPLFPHGSCLSDMPQYPYNYEEHHWYESRLSKDFRHRKYPHHDILGARVMESTDLEPTWRNMLHVGYNNDWLEDHKVAGDIVFPFSGYVAMAGEAVRQLTGTEAAFGLRHILVTTALVLTQKSPTEVITSLRPLRLTISQDSSWYEFTISAYNGYQWVKHCTGEVRAENGTLPAGAGTAPFPRAVQADKWFHGVGRQGLILGDNFRNIDTITTSTTSCEARGVVSSGKHQANPLSGYHMHPAVLDSALQLFLVALSNGLIRKHKNYLPVFCAELHVARTTGDFVMHATVADQVHDFISARDGQGEGVVNGQVVLKLSGFKVKPANVMDDNTQAKGSHGAAHLTWAADLDFVDPRSLFKISNSLQPYSQELEELARLATIITHERLADVDIQTPHLTNYSRWANSQVESFAGQPGEREGLLQRFQQLRENLNDTPAATVAEVLDAVTTQIAALLTDNSLSWTSSVPASTVAMFHGFASIVDSNAFFRVLGHHKPNLQALEIGGYLGIPSPIALQSLTLPDQQTLWSQYTFASQPSVPMSANLVNFPGLSHITLDIREDPAEQGHAGRLYDVVIVNDILHQRADLKRKLRNIHKLLAPTGRLLLQESFLSPRRWASVVLGTCPTWHHEVQCVGTDATSIEPAYWQDELRAAGFNSITTVFSDPEKDGQSGGVILARPCQNAPTEVSKRISLLLRDKTRSHDGMEAVLHKQGYKVIRITLQDAPPPGVDIISLLDLEGPFLENIADESYHNLQKFITTKLSGSGIFWVTRPCQVRVQDARYAQIIGLARVARTELLIDFATCEVDDFDASLPLVGRVLEKFRSRDSGSNDLNPDFEFAIDEGAVYIGRYFPFRLSDRPIGLSESDHTAVMVEGDMNTLRWARQAQQASLGDHDVEIEMHAVGVNFKDVLVGMNLIDRTGRYNGMEGAGLIRRVGPKVQRFAPGDRVMAFGHNTLSTLLVTNENICSHIPDSLNFLDAATMSTAYATAQQSLITVGQLQRGNTLLIHSACGGVGLAAIQIAQMIGAKIYATVGSERKVRWLVEECGIPRNQIFNSRDNSFVDGIYRETNGKGVDQILNSLSGELLHETWKCLAPFGKFIEIGKRELMGYGRLDMQPFLANRSYCCVDIDGFFGGSSTRLAELMAETLDYLEKGHIKPIVIEREFDASSVTEAWKYMLRGTHIGRIAIRIRDLDGKPTLKHETIKPSQKLHLDPKGSYLLVGGLGGLGCSVSAFMVEHGARNLIYLSRSAGQSDSDQTFIAELKSMNKDVTVTTVCGNISELDDVMHAVAKAPAPLKGILQLATVYDDENFARLSKSQWDRSVGPKVKGTWNLHKATIDIPLDFFVLFSSMSSVVGMPGQANYASGNSFLDAFVQHRNNLGLACAAVNFGPIADVGVFIDQARLSRTSALTGEKILQEQEMLDAVALAMTTNTPEASAPDPCSSFHYPNVFAVGLDSVIPLESSSNRAVWKRDRRMAIYHNGDKSTVTHQASPSDPLQAYITRCRTDPTMLDTSESSSYLAHEIGKFLFRLLLRDVEDIDINQSLTDLGLDSLTAIELRAWWRQTFGFDVSVLELLSTGSLEVMGRFAAERMKASLTEKSKA